MIKYDYIDYGFLLGKKLIVFLISAKTRIQNDDSVVWQVNSSSGA